MALPASPPLSPNRPETAACPAARPVVGGPAPSPAALAEGTTDGNFNDPKVARAKLLQALELVRQVVSDNNLSPSGEDRSLLDASNQELLRELAFNIDTLHYRCNLPKIPNFVSPPQGEVLLARSWPELLRHLELNTWEHHNRRFVNPFIFRGIPNKDFQLLTSLQRLGHPKGSPKERTVEKGILRSFLNYCHGSLDSRASLFEWLALAQHHGCPTRILDFTYSPLIALHFAVRDPSRDDADGAVWCVEPRKCLEASESYRSLHAMWQRDTGDSFWSICRTNQMISLLDFAAFHTDHVSAASASRISHLPHELDQQSKIRLLDKLGLIGDSLVFMEAPAMHERVRNQNHVFAFLTGPTQSFDEWLVARKQHGTYRKIIISKAIKAEVRQRLYGFGITERLLFPGLGGTSRWIKNMYTPSAEFADKPLDEQGEDDDFDKLAREQHGNDSPTVASSDSTSHVLSQMGRRGSIDTVFKVP